MPDTNAKPLVASLAPLVFVVFWATGFVVSKLSAGHVAAVWFLGLRFPAALLFMLALAFWQRARWPAPRLAFHAAVTGTFMHGLYLAPFYWAVAHGMPAGVISLIAGLQPLFTAFLAVPMLGEKVSGRHWLGLAIGLCGIGLVLAPKLSFALLGGITPFTTTLAVFGTASLSFATVYQKKFASGVALATGGVWQYVGASLTVLLISAVLGDYAFDGSAQAWAALGWAVLALSICTVTLMVWLINHGAVAKLSGLMFLVPGVSSLMTYVLFDEKLTPIQLFGMAVCAAAVLVVNRASATPPAAQ
jgi:drug/metabolite transporter (DMT)-like permease